VVEVGEGGRNRGGLRKVVWGEWEVESGAGVEVRKRGPVVVIWRRDAGGGGEETNGREEERESKRSSSCCGPSFLSF